MAESGTIIAILLKRVVKYALIFFVDWSRFIGLALRAKLEAMAAKEDKRTIIEHSRKAGVQENPDGSMPLDHELFAGEVHGRCRANCVSPRPQ